MTTTFSRSSLHDLRELWDFVAQDSVYHADGLIHQFQEKFGYLATHSTVGRPRPELALGCRCYIIGKYVIYYRSRGGEAVEGIEVLRVLHSARDIRRIKFPG